MSSLQDRAQVVYEERFTRLTIQTDRRFGYLLIAQWLLGIVLAALISPLAWTGGQAQLHLHLYAAVLLGGALAALPCFLVFRQPGLAVNRFVVAVAQMGFSILFIHLTGGRIETHFHVFGSLAFLAYYRDVRVLAMATAVTAIDHLARGAFAPMSVYGVLTASPWRTVEHVAWVLFEDVVLVAAIRSSISELRDVSLKQVQLEEGLAHIEEIVAQRTRQLEESRHTIVAQQQTMVSTAKFSALGEMAGGVAHEINNPLAIIRNCAEQMQEGLAEPQPDPAYLRSMLERLLKTTDRIAKIVAGLRTFSRDASRDPFQETAVAEIVTNSVSLCQERFKSHGIELRVPGIDPALKVECREVEISQVLVNLLNNAHDAVLSFSEAWVEVSARDADKFVEIVVTDSGGGISPELERKIFEPFFTTKGVGKGTGMGLSISLGIAHAHAGELRLDRGCANTRFLIRLPKRQRPWKTEVA